MVITVLELAGTAVFAASGALASVRSRLDVFGVVMVAMITALGGGVVRDVLLGVHPPATLRDWRFLLVPAATGLVVFYFHPQVIRLRRAVLLADAVGLGLFTTSGTATALALGAPGYSACLIGMTTGIGGGVARDVLLREVPVVLRKEIYAVAALAGAVVVVVGSAFGLSASGLSIGGAALIVAIRVLALWRRWNAPVARDSDTDT